MSTNYFTPPTLEPPRVIQNAAASIAPPTLPPASAPLDATYGALEGMPGYFERAGILKQLGTTGTESIYDKYIKLIRGERDKTSATLSGYGGLSFKANDPSTARDESLEISYETGRVGQQERTAYDAALAASLARGGVGRAELIGAALQRVSQEAQGVISQYAASISNPQGTGFADQMLTEQNKAIARYNELYGTDASAFLKAQMPAPVDAGGGTQTGADNLPPDRIVASGQAVSPNNEYVNGKTVYNGKGKPNTSAYRSRFKASDGYVVQEFPPEKRGGNYRVVVTFLYNPAAPASPGVNAGRAGLLPGTPAGDTTRPKNLPKPPPKKPPKRGK
jgi:hypothetical protein